MTELREVVHWFELGVRLPGVERADLEEIKYKYRLSPDLQGCKTDLFNVWLRNFPEPTWSIVVRALGDIRMESLASKLARKYGKDICILCNCIQGTLGSVKVPLSVSIWEH